MNHIQPSDWDHGLEQAALTDMGLRRTNNQDAYKVLLAPDEEGWKKRGHLMMVADGMGAHAAGELASKMAVDSVPLNYTKFLNQPATEAIRDAIEDANREINRRGQANLDFHGMGTTCTALLLTTEGAIVGHVGDSRAYRLRGGQLEQLTFDHSMVWEMRATGQIPADQVARIFPKNIITRSLGPNADVQVDVEGPFALEPGDTFLLCSDGLTGQVEDDEIGVILGCLPADEAARALVDLANLRGGPDNITVIVARAPRPPGSKAATAPLEAAAAAAEPSPRRRFKMGVVVGILGIGLFALGGGAAAAVGQYLPAIGCAFAALVCFVFAVGSAAGGKKPAPIASRTGEPARRGPYTRTASRATPEMVETFAKVIHDLKEAATEEHWTIAWEKFNSFAEQAVAAQQSKNYTAAVRDYCRAMSFMMGELRTQQTA